MDGILCVAGPFKKKLYLCGMAKKIVETPLMKQYIEMKKKHREFVTLVM